MSRFNPDLIQKARKGEIAILNDGSVEELDALVEEIWPGDFPPSKHALCHKYFIAHPNDKKVWFNTYDVELPAHSVKDFFMDQPESKESFKKYLDSTEPRTYRVTRSQMKEIHDSIEKPSHQVVIDLLMKDNFPTYENEAIFSDGHVSMLKSVSVDIDVLKKIFPEYFYIPEGEPVLVRQDDSMNWVVRISNGKGGAYPLGYLSGKDESWKQIIPYTKQPPK